MKKEVEELKQTLDWLRNYLVNMYLAASYAYYQQDISIMPDNEYDKLAKYLLDSWDLLTEEHHKILDKSLLEAGSGYAIKYPDNIESITDKYVAESAAWKWR